MIMLCGPSFRLNNFTEVEWKSNKIKFLLGEGGANSVKSQKYNLMIVRSSLAANILDLLV